MPVQVRRQTKRGADMARAAKFFASLATGPI